MNDYNKFLNKLDEDYNEKMTKYRDLLDDEKVDEARFEKIEANVIEISKTILKHRLTAFEEEKEMIDSYKQGLNNLLIPWEKQKENAVSNKDFENEHIETLKINKVHEIIHAFDSFVGEKND